MLYYKPAAHFLIDASHYEQVDYLIKSLKNYRDSAVIIHEWLQLEVK